MIITITYNSNIYIIIVIIFLLTSYLLIKYTFEQTSSIWQTSLYQLLLSSIGLISCYLRSEVLRNKRLGTLDCDDKVCFCFTSLAPDYYRKALICLFGNYNSRGGSIFLTFLAMEQDRFITVLAPPSFPDFPTNFSYIVLVGGDREKAHTLY